MVEGRQEDAEEFLTCLLNGLSDDMTEQIKLVEPESNDEEGENDGGEEGAGGEGDEEEDGWQEVGEKGKSCVTRRVAGTSLPATPIQVCNALTNCIGKVLNFDFHTFSLFIAGIGSGHVPLLCQGGG